MSEDDDDNWHVGDERQVMERMERWRDKNVYGRSEDIMEDVSMVQESDILDLLDSKERNLILAAELGRSLLEKNGELFKQNKTIAEECSVKLEVIEFEFLSESKNILNLATESI